MILNSIQVRGVRANGSAGINLCLLAMGSGNQKVSKNDYVFFNN